MDMGQGSVENDLLLGGSFGIMAAAHELKAPVALIRQLALELEAHEGLAAEQAQIVRQLILSSERSLRLTASLTRTAQLDDPMLIDTEPINAQQLCEEVAHELTPLYTAYDRDITVATRRCPPLVVANRELLRSILLQFGDNALHYANGSGVRFLVWQKNGEVRAGLRDYGIVSPKSSVQVLAGRPQGSGLGLKIAHQFAKAMHSNIGTIHHRQGMTFYVHMKASEQLSLL